MWLLGVLAVMLNVTLLSVFFAGAIAAAKRLPDGSVTGVEPGGVIAIVFGVWALVGALLALAIGKAIRLRDRRR